MHIKWKSAEQLVVSLPILILTLLNVALAKDVDVKEEYAVTADKRARGDKDGIASVNPTDSPVYLLYVYQNGTTELIRNGTTAGKTHVSAIHSRRKRSKDFWCQLKGKCSGGGGGWGGGSGKSWGHGGGGGGGGWGGGGGDWGGGGYKFGKGGGGGRGWGGGGGKGHDNINWGQWGNNIGRSIIGKWGNKGGGGGWGK